MARGSSKAKQKPKNAPTVTAKLGFLSYIPLLALLVALGTLGTNWLFHYSNEAKEAQRNHPLLVINHIAPPTLSEDNVMSITLPVFNKGSGSAYDVVETHTYDLLPFPSINNPVADPLALTRSLETVANFGSMQEIVAGDASQILISAPVEVTVGDPREFKQWLRSGDVSVRFRVLLRYRDGAGKSPARPARSGSGMPRSRT